MSYDIKFQASDCNLKPGGLITVLLQMVPLDIAAHQQKRLPSHDVSSMVGAQVSAIGPQAGR